MSSYIPSQFVTGPSDWVKEMQWAEWRNTTSMSLYLPSLFGTGTCDGVKDMQWAESKKHNIDVFLYIVTIPDWYVYVVKVGNV